MVYSDRLDGIITSMNLSPLKSLVIQLHLLYTMWNNIELNLCSENVLEVLMRQDKYSVKQISPACEIRSSKKILIHG